MLGHRGFSAEHLENSMEAFRAALTAGMDGFELDVQPTLDGVCVVLHDDDLGRTARSPGMVRHLRTGELPLLKNGEPVPRLAEVLAMPARMINVELKGRHGWRNALEAVDQAGALSRVIFSSFEHSEIFELIAANPAARCGLLWTDAQASRLREADLMNLPMHFTLHIPAVAARARPLFWSCYRERLVLWGLERPSEVAGIPFSPAILITDGV